MEYNLSGKNILLTGASGGLGIAIAKSLLEQDAKAALQFYRNKDSLVRLQKEFPNSRSSLHQCDLGSTEACEKLMEQVAAETGKINVLINNAGVYKKGPLKNKEKWLDVWEETININLKSAAYLARETYNQFVDNDGGIIINISSRAAFRGDAIDYMAYAASKSGLIGLTKTLAKEGGKHNIQCFSIAPGWIYTDMAKNAMDSVELESIKYEQSIHEWMRPKDIAPLVTLLCSGKMKFATGSNFDINGGSYMR